MDETIVLGWLGGKGVLRLQHCPWSRQLPEADDSCNVAIIQLSHSSIDDAPIHRAQKSPVSQQS